MVSVLNERVLVLNKNFYTLCIISVKTAMRLVFSEKAVIMDELYVSYSAESWRENADPTNKNVIRTPNKAFVVPEIIRLTDFDQIINRPINLTRQNIFIRDDFECQYCGASTELTVDHVIPKSRGAEFKMDKSKINSWENMVACCRSCNGKKDNMTPKEAGMILKNKPRRPPHTVLGYEKRLAKKSWKNFLRK